ncbi:MAG: hypothetical protein KDC66_21330 [Phaeodactylibacter sp.]|nr:hypothetical protein [Phaeodactylibacter sp.]MCB9276623.1 hypothetical protein [Lewinellaceae bacterium]
MKQAATLKYYLLGSGQLHPGSCGAKAWSLHQLTLAGFSVPRGAVIPYDTVAAITSQAGLAASDTVEAAAGKLAATPGLPAWLEHLAALLPPGAPLMLRTAAEGEDGQQQSMAGMYASVPGITNTEQLMHAFAACRIKGRLAGRLSFLLQEYVEADYAGVAFTVSPVNPVAHEILIELAAGQCELLTDGRRVDARIVYDWKAEAVSVLESTIGDLPHLAQLGQMLYKIQEYFGSPQDVEWAMAGSAFFVLQARPATRLFFPSTHTWTNANFRDGGIGANMPSPLMWSLYGHTFNTSIEAFAYRYHLRPEPHPDAWSTTFLGYPYWNLSATKSGASKVLGYVERQFDEGQGVNPYYEGDGYVARFSFRRLLTSLKALASIRRSIRSRFGECARTKAYFYETVLPEFQAFPLAAASLKSLGEYFEKIVRQHLQYIYSNYWNIIYDNTFVSTFAQNALARYNRRSGQNIPFSALAAGIEDIAHIRPMLELEGIAAAIRKGPAALAYWLQTSENELAADYLQGHPFPFHDALSEFLARYGYKSDHELEIMAPNWAENPVVPLLTIRQYLRGEPGTLGRHIGRQHTEALELKAGLRSPALARKVEQQRQLLWWKEEIRDITTHLYHLIRQLCLALGRRLAGEGLLAEPDDVFFLDAQSLIRLAGGGEAAPFRERVHYHRRLRRSFRHFAKPDIIFPAAIPAVMPAVERQQGLQGIGVCPGLAKGKALVIPRLDGEKPVEMEAGSILVTEYINPSHIPYFTGARAIVTANGGLLSHAAIMCREFGIPAVFGVPNLLAGLEPGRMLEVDGSSGWVKYV